MTDLLGATIVFEEGDPPSEVYPTRGTIVGTVADEHGDVWHVVHFDERNGYTLHPEERVLVRPRWQGRELRVGSRVDLLTKALPLGAGPVDPVAISRRPFGAWVTALVAPS